LLRQQNNAPKSVAGLPGVLVIAEIDCDRGLSKRPAEAVRIHAPSAECHMLEETICGRARVGWELHDG